MKCCWYRWSSVGKRNSAEGERIFIMSYVAVDCQTVLHNIENNSTPGLAPSDFHIFPSFKGIGVGKFTNDAAPQAAVPKFFSPSPVSFYIGGFKKMNGTIS